MRKYKLTLTEEQARLLSIAMETFARLGAGQWREAFRNLPIKEDVNWTEWNEDLDYIGDVISKHLKDNVDGWRKSLSIHSISEESKIAWDIHQVVRKRLAWERAIEKSVVESHDSPRNWIDMLTVDYDDPMKVSECPLATIEEDDDGIQ